MKTLKWISLLTPILIAGFIWSGVYQEEELVKQHSPNYVIPTNSDRDEWIESMHRAATGVNWRRMDQEFREQKSKSRFMKGLDLDLEGTWYERGSNNLSGRMRTSDVDFDENLIYTASEGGNIWVGTLEGNNWHSINENLQIMYPTMLRRVPYNSGKRIIVDQKNPAKVFFTDDLGINWSTGTGLDEIYRILKTVVIDDAQHTIYSLCQAFSGYDNIRIYKSTDLGNSFSEVARFPDDNVSDYLCYLWAARSELQDVFILLRNEVYSLDENDDLFLLSTININFLPSDIRAARLTGCTTSSSTYLYAYYKNTSGTKEVYRSTDSGLNWVYRGQVPQGPFGRSSFTCSTLNPNNIYMGGVDCFRSYDGGINWSIVNPWGEYYEDPENKLHCDNPGINAFVNSQGDEFVLICTDGGIYISYDSLLTVQNLSLNGLRVSQYYSTYTHRNNTQIIYAGSQDQGFQRTLTDPGGILDFVQLDLGDYGHLVSGDSGNSVWCTRPGQALYYPDASSIGAINRGWSFEGTNYYFLNPLREDPYYPNKAYLGGGHSSSTTGAHLWHLTYLDGTVSAEEKPFDFSNGDNSARVSAMAYSPLDFNYRYVLNSKGYFYYSTDGGDTWNISPAFQGPSHHYLYGSSIVASPTELGKVYIAGSGYSNPPVYVSEDHGISFTPMSDGLPSTLVYDMDITPNGAILFAATEVGAYAFIKSKGEWFDLSGFSAPDQVYWTVEFIPTINTARFGTYGRGILDFQIAQLSPLCEFDFNMSDGVGGNETLTCGLHPAATDFLDTYLGEEELPLPPTGFYCRSELQFPTIYVCKDIREGDNTALSIGEKEHKVLYNLGSGSSGLSISWDLPTGVELNIRDTEGGTLFNQDFSSGPGSYVITDPVNSFLLTVKYITPPFPVELASFTASVVHDQVLLMWITETEVDNYGFEVQRSVFGVQNSNWMKIGFVEGHGNSNSPKVYKFIDEKPFGGNKFNYRLKQIDTNGKYEYSNVVEVSLIPADFTLYQNYPNPFNPNSKIRFTLAANAQVCLKLFDVLGQEVMTLINKDLNAGIHTYDFDASGFNSGVYFYRVEANGIDGTKFTNVKKMLLLK